MRENKEKAETADKTSSYIQKAIWDLRLSKSENIVEFKVRRDLLIVAANRDAYVYGKTATQQERKKPHRTFPGHATSAEQKRFCFASLHFLCRRSVDVPVDVQTHLLFGPHTQAVPQRPERCQCGESPKSPPKGGAQALTLTIFTSAGKARHVACHHSRDKQEKPLDAPLKPDFYEAVNRFAVRGVCCLAVRANARNRLCCQNGPQEIRTTPHQERGGWV